MPSAAGVGKGGQGGAREKLLDTKCSLESPHNCLYDLHRLAPLSNPVATTAVW